MSNMKFVQRTMTHLARLTHRWSGWPGAYCMDCGTFDPDEDALAHGCLEYRCGDCGAMWPQEPEDDCEHFNMQKLNCGEHPDIPCTVDLAK